MPYIKKERRFEISEPVRFLKGPGELNYYITKMCLYWIKDNGGMNYAAINNVMGALECAKAEFYRRLAAPYEDKKIEENGDVY
jgi:hypothetical protein